MTVKQFNLSPLIVHHGITWVLLSLVYSSAYAQTSTNNLQYGVPYNFDPTIAIVIVILVCAFFFIGIFSIFIRQCSDSEPRIVAGSKRVGLDPDVIEKFPVLVYSHVKDHVKILECAICLSEFEDDETLRLLPKCNHVFHPECIDEWLTCRVTCPVCRANLQEAPTAESSTVSEVARQEVTINVDEEQSGESPVSRKNQFPRSHSTGHSLAENVERCTLRLPEELLRTKIMASAKLKRAMSFNVILAMEGSSSKGSSRGKHRGRSVFS
ncbi:E3 ubiquitin-protein ligase ATL31 [Ricinus communis]|uniref:RING-type E3 ubiquitin transferase n=1 Tax=Ricinus communis TaxID=3988 RepID=B9T5P1_RICCO|nr:E3 ubiquitin-protein ligase ATL31 [Ricinus communis]EEF28817.1 RING-H2 finger protein ATL5H precursor, putative [Ricinus communis]|eukprot:XP_002533560.1 E3 ubiquitin-protein ligase ATL31 [Ricinus communis]